MSFPPLIVAVVCHKAIMIFCFNTAVGNAVVIKVRDVNEKERGEDTIFILSHYGQYTVVNFMLLERVRAGEGSIYGMLKVIPLRQ